MSGIDDVGAILVLVPVARLVRREMRRRESRLAGRLFTAWRMIPPVILLTVGSYVTGRRVTRWDRGRWRSWFWSDYHVGRMGDGRVVLRLCPRSAGAAAFAERRAA